MGIKHIEDLSPLDFYNVASNLTDFIGSIKHDGLNITFGIDRGGWYSSREMKNGDIYRTEQDYPDRFWSAPFRAAHLACQTFLPIGQAEIIYQSTPNLITYPYENKIIFFNTDEFPDQTTIEIEVPYTDDGITIKKQTVQQTWSFEKLNYFILDDIRDEYQYELDEFKRIIYSPSGFRTKSYLELLDYKPTTKDARLAYDMCQIKLNDMLTPIKQSIKNKLIEFIPEGHEGIVLRSHNLITKIVDKQTFTKQNIEAHRVREQIAGRMFGKPKPKSILGRTHTNQQKLLNRYRNLYLKHPYSNNHYHIRTLQTFAEAYRDLNHVNDNSIGLFIGRFQPFHKGHEKLINIMRNENQNYKVIIIEGENSTKNKSKNPLPLELRKRLLSRATDNVEVYNNPYDAIQYYADRYKLLTIYAGDRDYTQINNITTATISQRTINRDELPISATDLRNAAKNGFEESFNIGKPECVTDKEWEEIFYAILRTR